MPDQTLICKNCNSEFVFSEGEQDFYHQKNLPTPNLCPICKSIANQQKIIPPKPQKINKEDKPQK